MKKKINNKTESKTLVKGVISNNKRTYNHVAGVRLNKNSYFRCWPTLPIQKKQRLPPNSRKLDKKTYRVDLITERFYIL